MLSNADQMALSASSTRGQILGYLGGLKKVMKSDEERSADGRGRRGGLQELSSLEGRTFSWPCPRRRPAVLKGAGEVSWGSAQESNNSHGNKIWGLGTLRWELLRAVAGTRMRWLSSRPRILCLENSAVPSRCSNCCWQPCNPRSRL